MRNKDKRSWFPDAIRSSFILEAITGLGPDAVIAVRTPPLMNKDAKSHGKQGTETKSHEWENSPMTMGN
jgi:hypothetical protein